MTSFFVVLRLIGATGYLNMEAFSCTTLILMLNMLDQVCVDIIKNNITEFYSIGALFPAMCY